MTQADRVPLLKIDRLSVRFRTRSGTVDAVRDVNFHVDKGETLGIVGESGSGKSVTAFTIMSILDAAGEVAGGTAVFGGMNLLTATEADLRMLRGREMSMIFQNPRVALNPIRQVGRQIEDVLRQHAAVVKRDLRARAMDLLDQVRIARPEQRYWAYPFELSGGMCQRVMIAMALACNPALLIADEPTTGLDVTTQKAVMDLIADLTRRHNTASILITHDLGLAAKYCDRIVVMQSGEIVEQGATAELFTRPRHPYTKRLISATPRPGVSLADIDRALAPTPIRAGAEPEIDEGKIVPLEAVGPLLEVKDLVREFPLAGGSGGALAWYRRVFSKEPAPAADEMFRAVDGIGFQIMPGESVGLVGESGCGKTTTSRMITRLLDVTSGQILFEGVDIGAHPAGIFSGSPYRSMIQMVFQDPTDSLNPRSTAFDTVAEPIRRLGESTSRAGLKAEVEELADMVGLPGELLTRFPHQLSGGQKARVGIARAIALRPKLLILDEPTSALDVSVQAVVLLLLDRLRRRLGMSYLFVSHDLNVVRLLCERVIVMKAGRIVEEGPTEELLTAPRDPYTRELVAAIPHFQPVAVPEEAAIV